MEAKQDVKVLPNYVYVIPPNRNIRIAERTLQLAEQPERPGLAHGIDLFFRSMAEDLKDKAVCVVLSGPGADWALGAKAIKSELGMVMVQDLNTAKDDGMPREAVAVGVADFLLLPDKMADELIEYVKSSYGKPAEKRRTEIEKSSTHLQRIFALLRQRTKHDFSSTEVSTVRRRIERRMDVNQIEKIEDYVTLLKENQKALFGPFRRFEAGISRSVQGGWGWGWWCAAGWWKLAAEKNRWNRSRAKARPSVSVCRCRGGEARPQG